ncbi:PAS fold-containing protein [Actinokineospora alba]|uniref:PAS fold-containing protein n=1 Tax=Actinokineospora alba TaxID=504798 RepID=A0A1H0EPP2_9PSEU|nr:SpoIIE family protein phosphatase [Actinokineospora alba]TDP69170.1 PAS domain-containing protein [Actinokineospora alba]SDI22828.1 PAS fold-containing protein [Actinokineospora alba]SDN84315.1 PAS fold-containing protein [Actinokineospora alba]
MADDAVPWELIGRAFDTAPAQVLIVTGPDHVLRYANAAATRVWGLGGLGVPGRTAFADVDRVDSLIEQLDRVLDTGEPVDVRESRLGFVVDGEPREAVLHYSLSPLVGATADRVGVLMIAADVTDEVTARDELHALAERRRIAFDRVALLARVTEAVSVADDPRAELAALADIAVPQLADSCLVFTIDDTVPPGPEGMVLTTVARTQVQSLSVPPPTGVRSVDPASSCPVATAIRTGVVAHWQGSPERPPWSPELRLDDWHRGNRVHAAVALPLHTESHTVGVALFGVCAPRGPIGDDDAEFLALLGAWLSKPLARGRRQQRTRDVATTLQGAMITEPPTVPGVSLAVRYQPAQSGVAVGGDWYDAFELPNTDLVLAVGDVAGHDISAAATMGQLRAALRAIAFDDALRPGGVLSRLDTVVDGLDIAPFTSLVLATLERRPGLPARLRWSNAGHPPPLLITPTGPPEYLTRAAGRVIMGGLPRPAHRTTASMVVTPGTTVVMFSDGLVENRTRSIDEGLAELAVLADRARGLSVDELSEYLLEHSSGNTDDDVALLVARLDEQ